MLVLVLMFAHGMLSAQMTVSIGEQLHCENSEVFVPVNVSDFNDVAAVTLYISLDTLTAEYIEIVNPNAQLSGGSIIANFVESTSVIIITWQSMAPATIPSGKLFDLKMDFHEGDAALIFLGDCEIALSDLTVVQNVIYVDGLLVDAIQFDLQPQPVTVTEGENTVFEVTLQFSGNHIFQWQVNDGSGWSDLEETPHYADTKTAQLAILDVPYSFNNYLYRCQVTFDNCSKASDAALLTVSPLMVVNTKSQVEPLIQVYPNPCGDLINFKIAGTENEFRLQLLNLLGEVLVEQHALNPSGSIILDSFNPGIYFLQLIRNNGTRETVKVLKQ
jgi:hypothetical protein